MTCALGGDVFLNQSSQPKRRPDGITALAILWTIGSLLNIYQGLNGVIVDLGALPLLSDPQMNPWVRFGLPAEMMISFFVLAFGFLTLLVVYGLVTRRSWSYHFGLAIPIFTAIINFASIALYSSAPAELELQGAVESIAPFLVINLIWLVILWVYLPKPHVKQYLNVIPTPPATVPIPPTASTLPVPPSPEPVATTEGKKFCRYCGVDNKTDAVFCEKCGKKIG